MVFMKSERNFFPSHAAGSILKRVLIGEDVRSNKIIPVIIFNQYLGLFVFTDIVLAFAYRD
jgi:hypothetical protein